MDEVLFEIIKLAIMIAGLVVTYFLVPLLKENLGEKKFDEIYSWVSIAVNAAEQIFSEPGMGDKKKYYVLKFLQDRGVELTQEELDALIEAVVYHEINRNKRDLIEQDTLKKEITEKEVDP